MLNFDRLPTITVITVVYNSAAHIESTIASVLENDYKKLRYIIIDGGSNDGTVEIINKYAERITRWVSEPDNGIYDAMNKGWALADNDSFILFLGAGDRLLNLPVEQDIYCPSKVIYGKVLLGEDTFFVPRVDYCLKLFNTLHHQGILVNKTLHPAPPFDTRYRVYADFDFNQRLYKLRVEFVYSKSFITYAAPGGLSNTTNLAEFCAITRKNFGVIWSFLAYSGFKLAAFVPFIKRFKPVAVMR